ncbi:unnamed protein product [Heligmosomoides polygyrus]|uniref:Reverse transcriptase domain-containing protein n=1 Tax=Heligmosomoides polygyrus TaxID=6339 RepID=A0A183GS27_HELPZ|nr:unnamed protein product [Heligmosomoides polygyrus]
MREKKAAVISRVRLPTVTTVDETWKKATDVIRQAAQSELGITKAGRRKVEKRARLWTDDVKEKAREKKALYHVFFGDKTADNWQKYQEARKAAKKAVAVAKATHCGDVNEKLESRDEFPHLAVSYVAPILGPVHKITVEETDAALGKMRPARRLVQMTCQLMYENRSSGTLLSGWPFFNKIVAEKKVPHGKKVQQSRFGRRRAALQSAQITAFAQHEDLRANPR